MPGRPPAAAPQLPLTHPAPGARQRLTSQPHQRDRVMVGKPGGGRLPGIEIQPGQAQPGPGGQDPGLAKHAPPLDPTGLLPAAKPLTHRTAAEQAGRLGR